MLREMQAAFLTGVFGPDPGPACAYVAPGRIPAERRLAIYRSNTLISLTNTLLATYPAVLRVLGEHEFRFAAARFVRRRPPAMPQLSAYGGGFAELLEDFGPARRHAFLPDLARLEWARQTALFSPDAEPLAPAALQTVPVEAYPGLRFALHPSARLISFAHPVQSIWEAARAPEGTGPQPEDVAGPGETVLVLRPHSAVEAHRLSAGDAALLDAVRSGETLAGAAEAAGVVDPDYDLQQGLLGHLMRGSFCGFSQSS